MMGYGNDRHPDPPAPFSTSLIKPFLHVPSSIMLPTEILGLICAFLPKQVLKQVRQASKTWDQAAVPYLFDTICISHDLADFRIANLVILQFKQYTRILVFSSVCYHHMDFEEFEVFKEFLNVDEEIDDDDDNCPDFGHTKYAFSLYRIARKNQQENLKNGSSSAYLSFALATLPNIRKIVLTDTSSSRTMSRDSMQGFLQWRLTICPSRSSLREATDHLNFPSAIVESGFSRAGYTNPWRLILSALSITGANIKEITMEPGDMELGTNTSAFSMPPGNLGQVMLCFSSLSRIRLSLCEDKERFSTNLDLRHFHKNVAKLLCSAVNLESLSLGSYDESYETPHSASTLKEILGRCKFPKLRSLNIVFFASSDSQLIRLLKHSRNLEHLIITGHEITEGSWARVAGWMRASLRLLKYAELNQLYGGFDTPWEDTEYMDIYGDVGAFLFAHGKNPFTTKSLEKYHADREAKRQVVDSYGGMGYLKAYDKFH